MKVYSLLITLLIVGTTFSSLAHNHWPPEFFDEERSSQYSEGDRELVNEAREKFNSAKQDTTRYLAIFSLVEELYHQDWQIYNKWMLFETKNLIDKGGISDAEMRRYKEMYASAMGNEGVILNETGDYDKAIEFHMAAMELNKEINDRYSIASNLNNLGISYSRKGDVLMSREFYESALHEYEEIKDTTGIARSLNNLGFVYDRIGDVVKSIEYHERSLELSNASGDEAGMANSFNNLAVINLEQGNRKEALEYYNKALEIRKKIGDKRGEALVLANLGYSHKLDKEYDKAEAQYTKALEMYRNMDDKARQAFVLHNLGAIRMDQEDWDGAEIYLNESKEIIETIDDPHGKSSLWQLMSRLDLEQGRISQAEEKALTSLEIAKANDYLVLIKNAAGSLVDVYTEKGDWKNRYTYYQLYIEMRDSLLNSETQKAAMSQALQFEYEKAELERKKEQEKKDALAQKELNHQRILSISITLFSVLLGILAFMIWKRLKLVRKQKVVIEAQNQEIRDSINYAKRIQTAILPPLRWVGENVESFVLYLPKDVVAGDFYWFVRDFPHIYFAAADCTGHGVPGAMVSVVCSNALNRTVNEYKITEPSEILNKVREIVIATFEASDEEVVDGMDIALCKLNIETKELVYAGAHNPLYVVSRQSTVDSNDGQIHDSTNARESRNTGQSGNRIITENGFTLTEYKADKMPIGNYRNMSPFTQHTIQLKEGDAIYVSSDGFADQFGGPKGRKYMYKPFKRLLLKINEKPMAMQKEMLNAQFLEWKGEIPQIDDVCVIGVRV